MTSTNLFLLFPNSRCTNKDSLQKASLGINVRTRIPRWWLIRIAVVVIVIVVVVVIVQGIGIGIGFVVFAAISSIGTAW